MIHKINKSIGNVMKKISNINIKTLIILFIILSVCILFIISNGLEYNLYNTKNNLDKFKNITSTIKNYTIKFDNNNAINKTNRIIYYNDLDADLYLQSITLNTNNSDKFNYIKNTDNIQAIFIIDNKLNRYNINEYIITSNPFEKSIIIDCKNKPLNLPVNPFNRDENSFSLVISYKNDDEISLPFNVGEKRFRHANQLVALHEEDNIHLKLYNEYSQHIKDIPIDNVISLQQFNKVVFQINKPKLLDIQKLYSEKYIRDSKSTYEDFLKNFSKIIQYKFLINIKKNTNNNSLIDIKPEYSIPQEGALCLQDNGKFLLKNNSCKLTLLNILPNEEYTLNIIIEYKHITNDNTRYSNKYSLTFKTDTDKQYDLLSSTTSGLKKYNLTNEMITLMDLDSKFNKEQNEQNDKLSKLETDLEKNLLSRNI
jgi:hypothetical protein